MQDTSHSPEPAPGRPAPAAPGARPLAARVPRSWREALWVTLAVRVGLILLGIVVWVQWAPPQPCHFEVALDGWKTFPPFDGQGIAFPFVGIWERWDACWYAKIATFGYEPGSDATAFFPAFPLLMRAVSVLLGGDVALSGMIVNLVASVVGLAGLHRLVSRDLGVRIADRTILYLSIFPAALFLYAPFTEALFLAATVWAFVGARERRWWIAVGAGLVAGLTRTQGVLLVLPVGWEVFRAWRAGVLWPEDTDPEDAAPVADRITSLVAILAPVAGFLAYAWYSARVVGLGLFDAQDAWGGRDFHAPWETIGAAIDWVVAGKMNPGIELLNVSALLLFGIVTVLAVRRLPLSYSLYAAASLLLLAVRLQPTPLTSTTRLLIVVFPVFAALGIAGRHRRFDLFWTLGSTLLLGVAAVAFVRGDFVA